MPVIDVRESSESYGQHTIIFGNKCKMEGTAVPHLLEYNGVYVILTTGENFDADGEPDAASVCVRKEDVANLIKALERAVELGWDK